jgi:hypothetical protein
VLPIRASLPFGAALAAFSAHGEVRAVAVDAARRARGAAAGLRRHPYRHLFASMIATQTKKDNFVPSV